MNNFVDFNFFFTKLSEIDPCEKRIDMLVLHAWQHIFMACSKLGAMAIYVVKQACDNDIMASEDHAPVLTVPIGNISLMFLLRDSASVSNKRPTNVAE